MTEPGLASASYGRHCSSLAELLFVRLNLSCSSRHAYAAMQLRMQLALG